MRIKEEQHTNTIHAQLCHLKETLHNEPFKLVHSSAVFSLSTENKCIIIFWRVWCPPCFNSMFLFVLAKLLMEGSPTRMSGVIPGPDVCDLLASETTVDDIVIKSAPCLLCLIRFFPIHGLVINCPIQIIQIMTHTAGDRA